LETLEQPTLRFYQAAVIGHSRIVRRCLLPHFIPPARAIEIISFQQEIDVRLRERHKFGLVEVSAGG